MKTPWKTPELIILARRSSDEILLTECRGSGGGPSGEYSGCRTFDGTFPPGEDPADAVYCGIDGCSIHR